MTSPRKPALLSQSEADALILEVQQQQATGTFDTTDRALITQLVEGFNDTRGMKRLALQKY